jgi:hypothetical protein
METQLKKKRGLKIEGINFIRRLTVKIQICLLRWLIHLQFTALPGVESDKLSHFALFRRPPTLLSTKHIYKT